MSDNTDPSLMPQPEVVEPEMPPEQPDVVPNDLAPPSVPLEPSDGDPVVNPMADMPEPAMEGGADSRPWHDADNPFEALYQYFEAKFEALKAK